MNLDEDAYSECIRAILNAMLFEAVLMNLTRKELHP